MLQMTTKEKWYLQWWGSGIQAEGRAMNPGENEVPGEGSALYIPPVVALATIDIAPTFTVVL